MSRRSTVRKTSVRRTSLPRRPQATGFAGMLAKLGLASTRLQLARARHR
jgi:hypothetical protein